MLVMCYEVGYGKPRYFFFLLMFKNSVFPHSWLKFLAALDRSPNPADGLHPSNHIVNRKNVKGRLPVLLNQGV